MRYCFDLDGVVFQGGDPANGYCDALPVKEMVLKIRALLNEGHSVIFYTARGQEGDSRKRQDLFFFAHEWLDSLFYRRVYLYEKPAADVYVDDKCMLPSEFLADSSEAAV